MGDFLFYLLKSGCYLIIFYLIFKLLMSGTTLFRFNRVTLLAGIVGCVFLPLIEFTTVKETFFTVPLQTIQEILVEQGDGALWGVKNMAEPVGGVGEMGAVNGCSFGLGYLYLLGGIVTLCRILLSFYRMFQLIRSGERHIYGKYQLIVISQPISSFCWGKYIIVSASDYSRQINEILLHETMHLRYRHTFDLLFMQFLLVFYWFNPAIWLLKRELQEVHEFEADNGVLNTGIDATRYQLLLVKKVVGTRLYSMANGFNHSKLKKRITMMLKERTNRWARLKLLLVVPIMGGALYAFAQPEVKETLTPLVQEVGQLEPNDSYWTLIKFFEGERSDYRNRMKGKKGIRTHVNSLYLNKRNQLMFNNQRVELEGLRSLLEESLYDKDRRRKQYHEVVYYQFDRSANEGVMGKALLDIKAAYDNVREKIALESSNRSKAYLDSVYPILVDERSPMNYANQKTENVITKAVITLYDSSTNTEKELRNFTLDELKKEVTALKTASKEADKIVIGLKADKNCEMGVVTDIKNVLREVSGLKINYSTN